MRGVSRPRPSRFPPFLSFSLSLCLPLYLPSLRSPFPLIFNFIISFAWPEPLTVGEGARPRLDETRLVTRPRNGGTVNECRKFGWGRITPVIDLDGGGGGLGREKQRGGGSIARKNRCESLKSCQSSV